MSPSMLENHIQRSAEALMIFEPQYEQTKKMVCSLKRFLDKFSILITLVVQLLKAERTPKHVIATTIVKSPLFMEQAWIQIRVTVISTKFDPCGIRHRLLLIE